MSASWLKTAGFLCLFYVTQIDGETKGVTWKNVGEDITITCNCATTQESMYLLQGLNKEVQLIFTEKRTKKISTNQILSGRSQVYLDFPKVDILIRNLTISDTGPYWCMYNNYNNFEKAEGQGSLLLVVTEKKEVPVTSMPQCDASLENKVILVSGITGGVLLIIACVLWILFKVKTSCRKSKPERGVRNDVYEDMRGTLKR